MWIVPDWPAPANIKAVSTTRSGGISEGPYLGLNLGAHVGDKSEHVEHNRDWLQQQLGLDVAPVWLNQTHSTRVISLPQAELSPAQASSPDADGSMTEQPGIACTVMTADCLPVLLCDRAGRQVAAVHAGWRGLADGILEEAVAQFHVKGREILVWMGPAIGASAFEVGGEVREQFMAQHADAAEAFQPYGDKWLADLYLLARQRLAQVGVEHVFGGDLCTFSDPARFYSYRRDGITGRQATLIWIES
ncbi:peptidoglycan editing factor PgeF [Photobacterium ganghwense]|uniref:Purine nucleoside phosphorylase n=1 Tax=Photobacterium ganghwense TaxID=320778 RepID=A0A0J1H4A8_9GAMM|nr:peptidoglycan editing factor PgeF [Photobacterium ganghwense]KLV06554.1 hypothetical protein ABT57_19360 [Photobacterium ganghwense]PSU03883.1 peptidoglycan editing factor PgeF [Photobacterium ganghwense]QSV14597.1 peptidoglycan editing factor PgeF [Photobacterium ganghwense]